MGEGYESGLFVNRELSWLEFNRRVLFEAFDEEVPLLERLKFISIYFSNLDEFFMVRVGSLTDLKELQPDKLDDKTGWSSDKQLDEIYKMVEGMQPLAEKAYRKISQELKIENIDIVNFDKLSKVESLLVEKYFNEAIYPLLSPQIIDRSHPFPFLKNKESYVVAVFDTKKENIKLGIIPIGNLDKYFVFNVDNRQKIVFVDEAVRYFAHKLFNKTEISEVCVVRITRNADISVDEAILDYDTDIDFRGIMQGLLKKRRRLEPVRLQITNNPSERLIQHLCEKINLEKRQITIQSIPMDFSFGFGLSKKLNIDKKRLLFPEHKPVRSLNVGRGLLTSYLEERDILLNFPFQSIKPFVDLLYEVADDPSVVSIKISLYRLANHSKIVAALAYAAERGKEVLCVLELRARFDEQSNIDYASILEDAGCTVIYGLSDYKIHAKVCVITKKHHNGISYITQIGTGNYNESTSEQYTDISFITSDYSIGEDASNMFKALCLGEVVDSTKSLWIAPNCYKSNLLKLIDEEIEYQRTNGEGYVAIKVNSMNDVEVMNKLVEASQAGVTVDLYIRGICCLLPKIKEYTDNIEIRSIVGKYLEHSRIFCFGMGGRERVFIGSGDLLNRNTRRRIEVFVPIKSAMAKRDVLKVLELFGSDNKKSWVMNSDGSYTKIQDSSNLPINSQSYFEEYFGKSEKEYKKPSVWAKIRDVIYKIGNR